MFTAWSYSRYRDHDRCPAYAKWRHLDKLDEGPKSPALLRGGEVDKEATGYLLRSVRKLPASLQNFSREFAALVKAKAAAQVQWALTVRWELTEWFGPQAWCRVVLDAHLAVNSKRARVIDFKTGKVYATNEEQLELYALAGFAAYPAVATIDTELWYLDQGELVKKTYARAGLPKLQKAWREKVIPLLSDRKFVPRPGDYCQWCAYSKRKGGPCKF
jgi:hypothetical protein